MSHEEPGLSSIKNRTARWRSQPISDEQREERQRAGEARVEAGRLTSRVAPAERRARQELGVALGIGALGGCAAGTITALVEPMLAPPVLMAPWMAGIVTWLAFSCLGGLRYFETRRSS